MLAGVEAALARDSLTGPPSGADHAERRSAVAASCGGNQALAKRLAGDPKRGVPHAHALNRPWCVCAQLTAAEAPVSAPIVLSLPALCTLTVCCRSQANGTSPHSHCALSQAESG